MPTPIIELAGRPEDMGRQHALSCPDAARAMVQARMDLALTTIREVDPDADRARCLEVAAAHLPVQERWAPEVHAEFMALAEGLDLDPAELLIGNGYTDYIDVLRAEVTEGAGCTSFIATGEATADGLTYVGQTWDMNAFAEPHMRVFRRRPERGPGSVTLTTAGCLSLIGLSEAGLAIGNTNVAPTDARPGAMYLAMIHQALRSEGPLAARAAITESPRASGHYYYLADADGRASGIETTRARHVALDLPGGLLVHTNHYHDAGLAELSREAAGENSLAREQLLDGFLRPRVGGLTLEDMIAGLRLDEGPHPVCRARPDDPNAVTTCGAAIMCPQRGTMWVATGHPAEVEFEKISP